MRHHLTLPLVATLAVLGCNADKTTTDSGVSSDDTGTGTTGAAFETYVNVTDAASGDLDCFVEGTWATQDVDPDKAGNEIAATAAVVDFQDDYPVDDCGVSVWYNNVPTGTPDFDDTTDAAGNIGMPWPVCQPVAYKTYTDPELEETKDTYQVNVVESWAESAREFEINSVSAATYSLIPSLLGVSPDATMGIVAGSSYDCNEDPIAGAQVVVVDASGNIPESLVVKYFVDDFPNRNQEYTSDDGLWVAINVPVGEWFVELWISDGAGGHTLIGKSKAQVVADSINIASIYTSYEDGIVYPANCLVGFE